MSVLVTYASRHGSTREIAERIAAAFVVAGLDAEARPCKSAGDAAEYDAVVVGSALYMFHWLKEAVRFLRRNEDALAGRPVWLFSSGPIGTEEVDAQGNDVRATAGPKEIAELLEVSGARDHHVFFGAFHQGKPVGLGEQFVMRIPAARKAFPEGDFRDWDEIDAWAAGIARELRQPPSPGR